MSGYGRFGSDGPPGGHAPETEPAARFGIDSLVDIPPPGSRQGTLRPDLLDPTSTAREQRPADQAHALPRRDLHWWIGASVVALALPLLVWQALDRASTEQAARVDHVAQRESAQVRPPDTISALERTMREQAQGAAPGAPAATALPPLPPLSSLSRGGGLAERQPIANAPFPRSTLPASRSSDRASADLLSPAVPDGEVARRDRLAAESERRSADALGSPLLAIGAGSAGSVGNVVDAGARLAMSSGQATGIPSRDDFQAALAHPSIRAGSSDSMLAQAIGSLRESGAAGGAAVPSGAQSDQQWLERARSGAGTSETAPPVLRASPGGHVVLQGTVIPAVLLTEINSALPGSLVAQVTQDIWDSIDSRHLVIPKGSRLIGAYNADVRPGQERVLAAFSRLILPGGTSIDLRGMQATDAQGRSGLNDQVERHFWRMFGSSFVIAGLASLIQRQESQPSTVVVVPGTSSATGYALSSAAGTVLVDTARALLGRNRDLPPTLIIRQGHRFSLTVQHDFELPERDTGTTGIFSR